jgi:alkylation response protein AidB-like acyl-CoA dehydrogenase
MDFELPTETRLLQETVRRFVAEELMPLEPRALEREARGEPLTPPRDELEPLYARARELGLVGLDVPQELGGQEIGAVAKTVVTEEIARSIVPFAFPPDAPNLHMMMRTVNAAQRERYLLPYARGETVSAIAISEPDAGSDPARMRTRATRQGGGWVIDGRKLWISRVPEAEFTIVMAVTEPGKGARGGITAFLVDRGTPGMNVVRSIMVLGGYRTYEVELDGCRVADSQVLGEIGHGFGPMQHRLTVRRLEIGGWSIGLAERALSMMVEHAKARVTFGQPLAERQTIQWWIADATARIHAARLMVREAAWRVERGEDVRTEASMIKVFATEMASEVVDHAVQAFGAMGLAKEMPLQIMYQLARAYRIMEGPSEVHRWVVARKRLAAA